MHPLFPARGGVQGSTILLLPLLLLVIFSQGRHNERGEASDSGDGGEGESAGIDIGESVMIIAIFGSCASQCVAV